MHINELIEYRMLLKVRKDEFIISFCMLLIIIIAGSQYIEIFGQDQTMRLESKMGLSIDVPSGWQKYDDTNTYFSMLSPAYGVEVAIMVDIKSIPSSGLTAPIFLNALKNGVPGKITGFQYIQDSSVEVGENKINSPLMVYRYYDDLLLKQLTEMIIITPYENNFYVITYSATENDYKTYLQTFRQMLSSISIHSNSMIGQDGYVFNDKGDYLFDDAR